MTEQNDDAAVIRIANKYVVYYVKKVKCPTANKIMHLFHFMN